MALPVLGKHFTAELYSELSMNFTRFSNIKHEISLRDCRCAVVWNMEKWLEADRILPFQLCCLCLALIECSISGQVWWSHI